MIEIKRLTGIKHTTVDYLYFFERLSAGVKVVLEAQNGGEGLLIAAEADDFFHLKKIRYIMLHIKF
jgi:hypothetical protein